MESGANLPDYARRRVHRPYRRDENRKKVHKIGWYWDALSSRGSQFSFWEGLWSSGSGSLYLKESLLQHILRFLLYFWPETPSRIALCQAGSPICIFTLDEDSCEVCVFSGCRPFLNWNNCNITKFEHHNEPIWFCQRISNHEHNYKCPNEGNCPEKKKVLSSKPVQSLETIRRTPITWCRTIWGWHRPKRYWVVNWCPPNLDSGRRRSRRSRKRLKAF